MQKQQRVARGLLFLACLLVVTCLVQRVVALRTLPLPFDQQTVTSQALTGSQQHSLSASTSTCEFSHKSLSGALPLLMEAAIFTLAALFIVLAVPLYVLERLPPLPQTFPPRCRIHLEFCNLRE